MWGQKATVHLAQPLAEERRVIPVSPLIGQIYWRHHLSDPPPSGCSSGGNVAMNSWIAILAIAPHARAVPWRTWCNPKASILTQGIKCRDLWTWPQWMAAPSNLFHTYRWNGSWLLLALFSRESRGAASCCTIPGATRGDMRPRGEHESARGGKARVWVKLLLPAPELSLCGAGGLCSLLRFVPSPPPRPLVHIDLYVLCPEPDLIG